MIHWFSVTHFLNTAPLILWTVAQTRFCSWFYQFCPLADIIFFPLLSLIPSSLCFKLTMSPTPPNFTVLHSQTFYPYQEPSCFSGLILFSFELQNLMSHTTQTQFSQNLTNSSPFSHLSIFSLPVFSPLSSPD